MGISKSMSWADEELMQLLSAYVAGWTDAVANVASNDYKYSKNTLPLAMYRQAWSAVHNLKGSGVPVPPPKPPPPKNSKMISR